CALDAFRCHRPSFRREDAKGPPKLKDFFERPLSMVADKFQWVFSEALLNACGKDVRFCHRERTITPFRLGLALTATCASQRVETIADFHCGFNALFGTTVTYKAFYNQAATPPLPPPPPTMPAPPFP